MDFVSFDSVLQNIQNTKNIIVDDLISPPFLSLVIIGWSSLTVCTNNKYLHSQLCTDSDLIQAD